MTSWGRVAGAALLACAGAAGAHELACEKTFNGAQALVVDQYPADVEVLITITNVHPTAASTAETVEITGLPGEDSLFHPPFTLGVGESTSATMSLTIPSYEICRQLAAYDGTQDDTVQNTVKVGWDLGSAQCGAELQCQPPGPPPTGGATRTLGFFKVHEDATQACLAQGPVDVGIATITTLQDALGLLWASPARHENHQRRSEWDRDALLLARQLFVATCNERLFGADLSDTLVQQSLSALQGTDCGQITQLAGQLDDFNNSNDEVPFPSGFDPGPATPQHAHSIADDPTQPTTHVCQ
jgi:hypothetical protein